MNARAIKKRLLKSARRVFWGRRAFITVRFPIDSPVLPPRPPDVPIPEDFKLTGLCMDDMWQRCNEDGSHDFLFISHVHGGCKPPEDRTCYCLEQDEYGGWSWWDVVCNRSKEDKFEGEIPVDNPELLAQRAHDLAKWKRNILFEDKDPYVLALMYPEMWAKTWYLHKDATHYYLEWSVKYFYPYVLRRFCAMFKSSVKQLRKLGVEAQIISNVPLTAQEI